MKDMAVSTTSADPVGVLRDEVLTPIEREGKLTSEVAKVISNPASISKEELARLIVSCPYDRIGPLFFAISQKLPERFQVLVDSYLKEADRDRKELYFRSLRNCLSNFPKVVELISSSELASSGFENILNIMCVPEGARQRMGLLTDFHFMSQIFLRPFGRVRFLPLPARFPSRNVKSPNDICSYPGPRAEILDPRVYSEVGFGRSYRYHQIEPNEVRESGIEHPVLKGPRGDLVESIIKFRYEASVLDYFRKYKTYFGIESEIPVVNRGPQNRVHAWAFNDVPYLLYGASGNYLKYFEDINDPRELAHAAKINICDLMRLARFGIFHTELAPIFHSIVQNRR